MLVARGFPGVPVFVSFLPEEKTKSGGRAPHSTIFWTAALFRRYLTFLDCGALPPLFDFFGLRRSSAAFVVIHPMAPSPFTIPTPRLRTRSNDRFIIIFSLDTIRLEPIDRLDLGSRRRALEPGGGTPRVFIRLANQSVLDGVLMHVIQTSQV